MKWNLKLTDPRIQYIDERGQKPQITLWYIERNVFIIIIISFFHIFAFSSQRKWEKRPLLASLLNIWFERSTTNFLFSLNTHSYNRERWNLIMIIIPIRYDFVLLHFSHVLFVSYSLTLYLMRLSTHPNVVRAFFIINIKTCHQFYINIDISRRRKKKP
jgi:hypothetical protein